MLKLDLEAKYVLGYLLGGLDRRNVCSQEHISLIAYSFHNYFAPLPVLPLTLTFENLITSSTVVKYITDEL